MGIDADSGLVYSETVVSAKPCTCLLESFNQYKIATAVPFLPTTPPNRQGAPSLQETALSNILRNVEALRSDDLVAVLGSASLLVDKLWHLIKMHHLDSLQVWKAFAHLNRTDVDRVREWYQWEYDCWRCLLLNLPRVVKLADSPTWLSDLHLECSNRKLRPQDLMHITKLSNVRKIRLICSNRAGEGFTDRVFEAWADAAKTEGAFPRLQAIVLEARSGGELNVTHWSLGKLWCFPVLEVFGLAGFSMHSQHTSKRIGSFVPGRKTAGHFVHVSRLHWRRRLPSLANAIVLEVLIGVSSAEYVNYKTTPGPLWFERDWTPWAPTAEEVIPWDFELSRPAVQPAKRRKVRDGKTQQLYQVMEGLV